MPISNDTIADEHDAAASDQHTGSWDIYAGTTSRHVIRGTGLTARPPVTMGAVKMSQADAKEEDSDKEFRRRVRHLKDDIPSLPEEMPNNEPPFFIPAPAAFRSNRRAFIAQRTLDEKLYAAIQKSEETKRKAGPHSADPIERLAACFADPKNAEGLRCWWERLLRFDQRDARKLVRKEMGIYGIQWPEDGNPFIE
ncbi:MAG: hypothetical protein Q9208_001571 [Pyrenodesmia sp. 3 TL-2023]